jgi:hypothetical protein
MFCAPHLRAAEEKAASTKKALPSAKEILERYAKAIGGKDAFLKHKSQHATGTVDMPAQGVSGKLEVFASRPNKLLMVMKIQGVGDFNTGYDGKVAWMSSALTGPMLLEGKMQEQISTQADFDHSLHNPSDYKTMEVLGVEEFNGEECYKLKLVHKTGFDSTEFFSTKTALQRGFITTQESPLGPVTATTVVTDYKQFGDLFMPSRISQKAMGAETVMTIDEMEYDKVDPSTFELPADVKALLEKPAEKPATEKGAPATRARKPEEKK